MKKFNVRKNAKIIILLITIGILLTSIFIFPITVAKISGHYIGAAGIISQTKESTKIYPIGVNDPTVIRGEVIFSQRPYTPEESYNFYTSDSNTGYFCQEDFWNLSDLINDVHWYGLSLIFDNGWIQGNPNGMQFEIIFYEDNGGYPGNVIATFSDLNPNPINTGIVYYYTYNMYYWEIDLPEIVSLVDGWITIQSTYCPDGSWFLWSCSPEGNYNALQSNYSIIDNLAFNLTGGWFIPNPDIKIDSILQPISGPAGIIAPIINVSNIGNMDIVFPINVQINSTTLEYNQTQDVIHLWPGYTQQIVFPPWKPNAWNNTIENTTIEYTITATAILDWDCNQSDNILTKSFNLTYTCELHRLFLVGFITNKTQDNRSISFNANNMFSYDYNNSTPSKLSSDEKIIVLNKHRLGFVAKNIIIGRFDGVVYSFY